MNLSKPVLITGGILIAGALAWWFISPLFIDRFVNEELPASKKTSITHMAKTVSESKRDEFITTMNEVAKENKEMEQGMPNAKDGTVLISSGSLRAVAHEGSGSVRVLRLEPYKDHIVRFENLDVLNGPDLHVYLSTGLNIESKKDLAQFVDLGKLKGNQGNQNYVIPDNIDLSKYNSVVVYCKSFDVVFAAANLESLVNEVAPATSTTSTQ